MSEKRDWIKYYVNEDKKVVVAKMNDTAYDALNLIAAKRGHLLLGYITRSRSSKPYKMKDSYVARARCHEDDTFDVEIGKELAKNRVLFKYYEDLTKVLQKIRCDADKNLEEICRKPFSHFDHITAERIKLEEGVAKN